MIDRRRPVWHEPTPGDSLWSLIAERAARSAHELLAIDDRGERLTFAEYHEWCRCVAGELRRVGVAAGDVVTWQLPTWFEAMVVAGALDLIGAVQNPALPPWRSRELAFITAQAGATWYLHPGTWRGFDYAGLGNDLAASNPALRPLLIPRDFARCGGVRFEGDGARSEQRWLFYTSGTTGSPKGVRHGHRAVALATISMCRGMRIGADDRGIVAFPFTHIGGINWLMAAMMTGCSLLLIESFADAGTMGLIARSDVTLAGVTTAFHLRYLQAQREQPERRLMPRVRAFPGGAAPKPPALHHDLVAVFGGVGIVSGFGLTEFPMITMGSIDDPADKLARSEGRPSPNVELIVVGPDGQRCARGVDGELRARGPHRMLGYVDAALDADVFDAEGFVRTGDIGHLDEAGYLIVTGRAKEVIVRKGENVSAQEIENLLYEHPAVGDIAVIGVPDPERGEMVCAVVVPAAGAAPPTLEQLVGYLREKELMPQKLPERLELLDSLPRNGAGKVQKAQLRRLFGAREQAIRSIL